MTPEYINAWKKFPRCANAIFELCSLVVVYDEDTLKRIGIDQGISAATLFVEPGHEYKRASTAFQRATTYVIVLDAEDKAMLENPLENINPWDWIHLKQHDIYNKYFPNLMRQSTSGTRYNSVENEFDVVIWGSPIWTNKLKDRRMPYAGHTYFHVHVPEEPIEGVDDEHTVNLLDQAQAITHNRLSALREKIPAFKNLKDEEQLAILTELRDKDVDDFVKVANDRNEFINADVRRLREAMTEFGVTW
jgi:hypothetical protein